jgi:hypothetical protein
LYGQVGLGTHFSKLKARLNKKEKGRAVEMFRGTEMKQFLLAAFHISTFQKYEFHSVYYIIYVGYIIKNS